MKQLDTEIKETQFEDDKYAPELFWHLRLSHQERKLIHLSRAFVFSPQIMVLHKPLDDLEKATAIRILELLSDYVHRGHRDKKRRTIFLSSGTFHMRDTIANCADYLWDLTNGLGAGTGLGSSSSHWDFNLVGNSNFKAQGPRTPPLQSLAELSPLRAQPKKSVPAKSGQTPAQKKDEVSGELRELQAWAGENRGGDRSCYTATIDNCTLQACFSPRKLELDAAEPRPPDSLKGERRAASEETARLQRSNIARSQPRENRDAS